MTQRELDEAAHTLREFVATMLRTQPVTNLSRTAAGTLSLLDARGPQRITALAANESVTQPAMSGLIQRLENTGLVTRTMDPGDGRASLIAITGSGRAAMTERRKQHDASIAAQLAQLDPDELALLLTALPVFTTMTENS